MLWPMQDVYKCYQCSSDVLLKIEQCCSLKRISLLSQNYISLFKSTRNIIRSSNKKFSPVIVLYNWKYLSNQFSALRILYIDITQVSVLVCIMFHCFQNNTLLYSLNPCFNIKCAHCPFSYRVCVYLSFLYDLKYFFHDLFCLYHINQMQNVWAIQMYKDKKKTWNDDNNFFFYLIPQRKHQHCGSRISTQNKKA